MTLSWTPERVERLTELWHDGVATLDIAVDMGISKDAVAGKARHLGLPKGARLRARATPGKVVLARALVAQGLADQGDMTAPQLLEWFEQAQPGERLSYFTGNLARARGRLGNPALVRLADAARELGTPQAYEVHLNKNASAAAQLGQGLAHLAQRRIEAEKYEYYITKSREAVVA